jgi:lipoprotein-releasing system permease protein
MVVMIISIATGTGLQKRITEKIISFTGDFQVVPYMSSDNSGEYLMNADSIARVLNSDKKIRHVHQITEKGGLLKTEDDFEGVTVKGVGSDFDWLNFSSYLQSGVLPHFKKDEFNDSILVSSTLMKRLELQEGQEVVVFFLRESPKPPLMRRFMIAGEFATGMAEFDGSFIIAHEKHIRKLNKWEEGSAARLEVFLYKSQNAESHSKDLRFSLPLNADLRLAREAYLDIFQWIDLFDVNIYLIIVVMIAVGLVNSVTALLTIILEKRRSIGLLKALGASEAQLRRLFRLRSMHIVGKGLMWGNLIGIGLCAFQIFTGIVRLDPEVYYVDKVPIDLNFWYILLLNIGVFLTSYLAMSLPVRVISRMQAAESLKAF